MVDIASISAVVAAIGVLIGVAIAILQLRDLVKTRQTDLVIRLYSTLGSNEMLEAWEKVRTRKYMNLNGYLKKYGLSEINKVAFFSEGIGVLLHRRFIDIGLVDDLFSTPIKITWEKMKPISEGARKHYNRPQIFEWYEYLYNELKKREQTTQAQA